jgi:hypothetical protein
MFCGLDEINTSDNFKNFSLLRRIALNALERESSFRRSIRQKSRRAAMNDQYMVSILAAAFPNSTLS